MKFKRCLFMTVLAVAGTRALADTPYPGNPPGFEQTPVFVSGSGGYLFYRIPSAVVTAKGTLLVFAEGRRSPWGPHNDSGEINVVMKRSEDGGRTFGPQQVVWADGANTCGNPTAVVDEDTGVVWLLMTRNNGQDAEGEIRRGTSTGTRTVWVTYSEDDGRTWAGPREITSDTKRPEWTWYATGPGVGIQIKHGAHKGRLVVPCNHGPLEGKGSGNSHVIYSDDHGKTWALGGEPPGGTFNESQIVELADGSVALNMRNGGGRKNGVRNRGWAVSRDGGSTFEEARHDEALIEPICQGSVVRYTWPEGTAAGKGRILFSNPASTTERVNMTVRVSYDDGKTWPVANLIHKGWSCYSCLVPLPDGTIGLLYEAGNRARYERIDFARLSLEWVSGDTDRIAPGERPACPAAARVAQ